MAASSPQVRKSALRHRLGMGLSLLCLLHCLALPWLLASLPLAVWAMLPAALQDNQWLHAALIVPVVLVSGPALLRGRPGMGQIALVLTAFGALGAAFWAGSQAGEQALTVLGAALLLGAHIAALRRVRER